jgi:hypothetical protein
MLVVVVDRGGIFHDLKVFSAMADAIAFGKECSQAGDAAVVYDVPTATDARAAKAAVEMGEANLIAVLSHRPSETEIADRQRSAHGQARLASWQSRRLRAVDRTLRQ